MTSSMKRECLLLCADPETREITEHGDVVASSSILFCNTGEAAVFYILLAVVLVGALNWLSAAFLRRDAVLSILGGNRSRARYVYVFVGACGVALVAILLWIGIDDNRRCSTRVA